MIHILIPFIPFERFHISVGLEMTVFSVFESFIFFHFILAERRSQFTRYRSWNSRMYPVWKDGDTRFRNCWMGEF